jgi:hypothetical protein
MILSSWLKSYHHEYQHFTGLPNIF